MENANVKLKRFVLRQVREFERGKPGLECMSEIATFVDLWEHGMSDEWAKNLFEGEKESDWRSE